MAIDPEQFDQPVIDYDFAKIDSVRGLIDQMATAGGFTATKLALARDILRDAMATIALASTDSEATEAAGASDAAERDDVDGGSLNSVFSTNSGDSLNWLSFPACLMATGARGFFVEAARRRAFNVIVTTCGTLDHDIARSNSDHLISTTLNWVNTGSIASAM
jgi:deoxyhypusine synthase